MSESTAAFRPRHVLQISDASNTVLAANNLSETASGFPLEKGGNSFVDLELLADETRKGAGVRVPVHAYILTRALGVNASTKRFRERCKGEQKSWTVFGTRVQELEACAHSLAHLLLDEVLAEQKIPSPPVHSSTRNHRCNMASILARNLLLPPRLFAIDIRETGRDLIALKKKHPHVSCETLLQQMVSVAPFEGLIVDQAILQTPTTIDANLGFSLSKPRTSLVLHGLDNTRLPASHPYQQTAIRRALELQKQQLSPEICSTLLRSQSNGMQRILLSWPKPTRDPRAPHKYSGVVLRG